MNARVQRIGEQVLGVAVFIDGNVIETFIDPQQGEIEYMLEATPDRIMLRIGSDRA